MRALLLSVCLLGLVALFAMSEPLRASTQSVTSDDVELVSEQTSSEFGPTAGKNGSQGRAFGGKNGISGRSSFSGGRG